MQTIAIRRWKLQSDPEATRRAFADMPTGAPESCGCGDCLNFAAARDRAYPSEVLTIFEQLGIDRSKESEIWHTHSDALGLHHYGGFFHLVGAIEEGKDAMVMVNGHGTYTLRESERTLISDLRQILRCFRRLSEKTRSYNWNSKQEFPGC